MRTCLFCESTKLTREHIWPDWAVEFFKKHIPPRKNLFTATRTKDGAITKSWKQNTILNTEPLVCGRCNNTWMSKVEQAAKPVLTPLIADASTVRTFAVEEQLTLAIWMTLRSMVCDAVDAQPYYTALDRRTFATRVPLLPPSNTHVWLAPYLSSKHTANIGVMNLLNKVSEDHGLHVTTCVMNQIVLQLLTWKGLEEVHPEALSRIWDSCTRRVWPFSPEPVAWPPSQCLSETSLKTFTKRLRPGDISRA